MQACAASVNLPLVQMESNHRRYHVHEVLTESLKQSQSALGVGSESRDQLGMREPLRAKETASS